MTMTPDPQRTEIVGNAVGFVAGSGLAIYCAAYDRHWAIPHTAAIVKVIDCTMIVGLSSLVAQNIGICFQQLVESCRLATQWFRGRHIGLERREVMERCGSSIGMVAGLGVAIEILTGKYISLLGLGDPMNRQDDFIIASACVGVLGLSIAVMRAAAVGLYDTGSCFHQIYKKCSGKCCSGSVPSTYQSLPDTFSRTSSMVPIPKVPERDQVYIIQSPFPSRNGSDVAQTNLLTSSKRPREGFSAIGQYENKTAPCGTTATQLKS